MTKEYIYTVENLAKTFAEHSEIFKNNQQKNRDQWKIRYPDEPIPDYLYDDFSTAKAFQEICEEICRIRKVVIRQYDTDEK